MPESLPMMPWYPRDFIASTRAMRLAERGAYRDLLDFQWDMGKLPKEPERLARLLGVSLEEFTDVWQAIGCKFIERDGYLINERVDADRKTAIEQRERKRNGADKTNAKRYGVRPQSVTPSGSLSDTDSDTHSARSPSPSPTPIEESKRGAASPPRAPKKKRYEPIDWTTIPNLDVPWWNLWLAFRRKAGHPVYVTTNQAVELAKYPTWIQREAIDHSIRQQYQGLFPEKVKPNGKGIGFGPTRARFDQHTNDLQRWLHEQLQPGDAAAGGGGVAGHETALRDAVSHDVR